MSNCLGNSTIYVNEYVCNMALCKTQNKVNAQANIICYYINCPFLTVEKFGRKLKVMKADS